MIVKLIIHKNLDAISIWNEAGDRLYYSDKEADIKTAKDLLLVQKKLTDSQLAAQVMGETVKPEFEQRMNGYFNACWKKKIVQLLKRSAGYTW